MIQDIYPSVYSVAYKNTEPGKEDTVFVFGGMSKREDRLLLKRTDQGWQAPCWQEVLEVWQEEEAPKAQFLFSIDDKDFYMLCQFRRPEECLQVEGYSYEVVKAVRSMEPRVLCFAAVTAYHLYDWYRSNRFCGKCGQPTRPFVKERAIKCTCCDNLIFPKLCPAVIVGVTHGDYILMSQYANRGYHSAFYALIAGFCEIGETVEETVAREVMEEVGLKVTNLRYVGSQPWGFDADLLMGYFCDVDGDIDITLDHEELANAAFFHRSQVPYAGNQGNTASLTATMIEAFRKGEDR